MDAGGLLSMRWQSPNSESPSFQSPEIRATDDVTWNCSGPTREIGCGAGRVLGSTLGWVSQTAILSRLVGGSGVRHNLVCICRESSDETRIEKYALTGRMSRQIYCRNVRRHCSAVKPGGFAVLRLSVLMSENLVSICGCPSHAT